MATGVTNVAQAPAHASVSESQAQNGTPFPKRDLASWWKTFKRNAKKEEEKGPSFRMLARWRTLVTGDAC